MLRVRKNSLGICRVSRKCICSDWPGKVVCGVCTLRYVMRRKPTHKTDQRIFPSVAVAHIRILKDIGSSLGLGIVTWHGFRRGRTVDLLERGGANGVCL